MGCGDMSGDPRLGALLAVGVGLLAMFFPERAVRAYPSMNKGAHRGCWVRYFRFMGMVMVAAGAYWFVSN